MSMLANLKHSILDVEEERKLIKLVQEDGSGKKTALNTLVKHNQKFVYSLAKKYYRSGQRIDIEDLIQEGNQGLMTAIERFDLSYNHRLVVYARWWLMSRMQRFVFMHRYLFKFSTTWQRRAYYRMADIIDAVDTSDPDERERKREQTMKELNMSESRYYQMEKIIKARGRSFDYIPEDAGSLAETLPDKNAIDPHVQTEQENLHNLLKVSMKESLNKREYEIIDQRFFSDQSPTLNDIGLIYGVTRERVRQIQKRAIEKLTHHVVRRKNLDLQEYLQTE